MIGVILGTEFRAMLNRLRKGGPVRIALVVIFLIAAVVFIGGATFAVGATAGHFLPSADDTLLSAGFTALSALMLVIGFPTVIATFFVGRDLLQLVIAPVPAREIFVARLLMAMSANLLVSGILTAGVLGLGFGAGASPIYYVVALPLIFIEVLIITSMQAILMTVVLRWVPARLARDVAAGVAGLTGAGFYLAWNLSLRGSFRGRQRPNLAGIDSLVKNIDWLPTTWPGHALSAVVLGDTGAALVWTLLTLAFAALLLLLAEQLYERTLLAGVGIFGSTPSLYRRRASAQASRDPGTGAGSPVVAIARKDWLGYRRDIRRLSRLLPAILFPIGYAVALSQPSRNLNGFWTNVLLVSFMAMFMSSSLASPAIPSEKRGFNLLRMAPVSMWLVLRAKVLLTLPAVVGMSAIFAVVVAVVSGSSLSQDFELGALLIWLAVGFVAIGVSAGGIDPRFEATDDRRAIGLIGTLTAIGGSLAFGLLSIAAFGGLVFGVGAAVGEKLPLIPSSPTIGALLVSGGVVAWIAATAVVAFLLILANSRMRSFEAVISATS